MTTYILYALIFITVILLIEGLYFFVRGRLSGDAKVNRRIDLIQKLGQGDAGLSLLRHHRRRRAGNKFNAKLDSLIWTSNINVSPWALLAMMGLVFMVTAFLAAIMGGRLRNDFIIATVASQFPLGYIAWVAKRRRKKFNVQLIGALDLISRGLQAGHPAAVALEIVANEMPDPIGTEFGLVIDEINYGLDRNTALRNLTQRFPSPDMQFFSAALEVQRETGGNLVEVLDNLTKMMRDRRAMDHKVRAMSAEGRVTGWIVGLLPLLVAGVITLMLPTYYTDHFENPQFFVIMAFPIATYLVGLVWMKKLVSIKV